MLKDYLKLPWKEIKRRKLRSYLTLLGVFIGIAAIVSLISLGQGLENAIDKQFQSLGKDKLFITTKGGVFAGLGSSIKLYDEDLDTVRKVSGVKMATGMGYTIGRVEFNDKVWFPFVMGISIDPDERELFLQVQSWHLLYGRDLKKGDNYKTALGYEYTLDKIFGKTLNPGDKVSIENKEFKVVGLYDKIGSPSDDQALAIPLDTYRELFGKEDLFMLLVQTQAGEDPAKIAEDIKKELRRSRDVEEGEEDFEIQSPEQLVEAFSTILNIVQIVLIGIAGISLLVGGIGIMNTMYTAVLQRTREIGILKALGAKNTQIMLLFLVESGLYGLGGGIIGIVLGLSFAKAVEYAFAALVGPAFLAVEVNWLLIFGTLLFSFLVGCLSGIAPAWKAAKLNPVDALRYE